MVTSEEEFILKFHKLEGITVSEKRKSFNKLIRENTPILKNPETSKNIIAALDCETHLEKIFRTELLLFCHCVPELLEILKNGNEVFISKIIKCPWFLKEALEDMTPQQILDEVIHFMSYSIRMKFLKKVMVSLEDEEKIYELFGLMKTKYGLQTAMPLLLGCSLDQIDFIMKNDSIVLTENQLKHLIQKAPKLLLVYVDEHKKHRGYCHELLSNERLLRYLFLRAEDIYKELENKYKVTLCHGRRTSKRLFDKEKDEIVANPSKFENKYEQTIFVKKLESIGCFNQYFQNAFPKSVDEFSLTHQIEQQLSKFPKSKRFNLLKNSFEQLYNVNLFDCVTKINKNMLNMMPDVDEREKISIKLLELTGNHDFVVYQKTSSSIPYIYNKINLSTNIQDRKRLLKLLAKTCQIHNDTNALIKVIKYVSIRHRNDDEIMYDLLDFIEDNFDLHKLTKAVWEPITELIEIYSLKCPKHHSFAKLMLAHMEFKYNNGESFDKNLLNYIDYGFRDSYRLFWACKNVKFLHQVVQDYIRLFPNNQTNEGNDQFLDDKNIDSAFYKLCKQMYGWNKDNPGQEMSYVNNPKLMESVKNIITADKVYLQSISFLICIKDSNDLTDELVDIVIERSPEIINASDWNYLLRWYPTKLLNHKKSLTDSLMRHNSTLESLSEWIKCYDYLQFPSYMIKAIQDKFTDERNSYLDYSAAFKMLATLMKPVDYKNFIVEYKPKNLTVDMTNEEEKKRYELYSAVAKSFKCVVPLITVLSTIIEYCGGDYLQHVLDSLYKSFHHTPENLLFPYLNELENKAVSVRKHALFLTCRIESLECIKKVMKSLLTDEKNKSIQKRLILTVFKCFLNNQSADFWNLLKTCFMLLDDEDDDSFKLLISPEKHIPKDYFCDYYEEMWSLVEKRNLKKSLKYTLQNNIAVNIESSVKEFPTEFCYKVIDALFFQFNEISYQSSVNTFVSNFLLHNKDTQRFQKIFKVLESSKALCANDPKLQRTTKREMSVFINNFCSCYLVEGDSKEWDVQRAESFVNQLLNLYPDVDFFDDYVLLKFSSILIISPNLKIYTQNVSQLCEEMIQRYGPYVLEDLQKGISLSLNHFIKNCKSESISFEFIKDLLSWKFTEVNCLIALYRLLTCISEQSTSEFEYCLDMLKNSNFPYVKIYLKKHILI